MNDQRDYQYRATFQRTYLQSEWDDKAKRIEYIEEAREQARNHRPCVVSIYVTPRKGRKGSRIVQVISH